MKFSLKSGRNTKPNHHINLFPEGAQHPDLPLSPSLQASSARNESPGVNRRSSLNERFSSGYARDRRSIAIEPGYEQSPPFSPDDIVPEPGPVAGGITRSQTVVRRDGTRRVENLSSQPSPLLLPDLGGVPASSEQQEPTQQEFVIEGGASMNQFLPNTPGKTSSDSGRSAPFSDRFNQRRLQRLNTEASFREQRQGGGQTIYSPPGSLSEQSGYASAPVSYPSQDQHPQYQQQPAQPHPSAYQSERTVPAGANAASTPQTQPVSAPSRTNNFQRQDSSSPYVVPNLQYSPTDPAFQNVSQESIRSGLAQSRSFVQQPQIQQQAGAEESSMSSSNNGNLPAPKPSRTGVSNRQSIHNGVNPREASTLSGSQQVSGQQGGVPAFNAAVVPPPGQHQSYQSNPTQPPMNEVGRKTPQPLQTSEEMTEDEVNQLIKDHKELREKYTKVKKYYFEKEDQVKQLQNSLAHQRLSQSRTSLDDSEYTTRFNRLEGLVAQLAFSIRKSWRSVPSWLVGSVNKDAIAIGKQEMTAAGRAFISCWLVEEVFNRYFHPDLDPALSAQLKSIQQNIRHFAPTAQTAEEEEYLTSKVVNWRLSTLEGLSEALRSKDCAANRSQLTEMLKDNLVGALATHLNEPTPADLEGGVHMIIELVVSIAIHLPLESRDVVIEYFLPGHGILHDQMKIDTGIPPLLVSIADDQGDRASVKSADSDIGDGAESEQNSKKRSMLGALTGTGKPTKTGSGSSAGDPRKHAGAGGSSSSLNRPDSSQGMRGPDLIQLPKVRMAAGIGVQIRGRSVLVRAPIFPTST